MKILVDEMPKEAEECCFHKIDLFQFITGCAISGKSCRHESCPFLKPLDKPVKDDCK